MTLFIKTPRREIAIDDIYLMVLTFLISYALTKIFKEAIEKQIQKKNRKIFLIQEAEIVLLDSTCLMTQN